MDVVVTWTCLGGGALLIILSMVVTARLQARTREAEESEPKPEAENGA